MNKLKAESKIRRKVAKAKTCPFCGNSPQFEIKAMESSGGKFAHYAMRKSCCRATGTGQTELFFSEKPNYALWRSMAITLINIWNDRK